MAFSSFSLAAAAAVGGCVIILVDFSAWVLAATMVFRPLGRWCDLTRPLVGAASWGDVASCPRGRGADLTLERDSRDRAGRWNGSTRC